MACICVNVREMPHRIRCVYSICVCVCIYVNMSDAETADATNRLSSLALSETALTVTCELGAVEGLTCTRDKDALRLALATAPASPGEWAVFQDGPACLVMPNRCFRKQAQFVDGDPIPIFSGCVSSPADIPDYSLWTQVEIDGVTLRIDQYSARVALEGVIVTRWTPDGMGADDGFAGLCMHLVDMESGEVMEPARISELAAAKLEQVELAHNAVNQAIQKMKAAEE